MKKVILATTTVILFGLYAFLVRSGSMSTQLYKLSPVPVRSASTTGSDTGKVTKNSDCVFIPYKDDENSEGFNDGETGEVQTANGYYKCTTITMSTPSISPAPASQSPRLVAPTPPPAIKPKSNSVWKNGTFIGDSVDAYYGNVQVSATFSGDRLTNIAFLDYPQDRRTSLQKSDYALPILKSEAISAQSSSVDTVSGVTYTSEAFINSLAGAMSQAKI